MILSRKRRQARTAEPTGDPSIDALFEEIESLSRSRPVGRDVALNRRILHLRHQAGLMLTERPPVTEPAFAEPDYGALPGYSAIPELPAAAATPELLRAAILRNGCLLVRGLISPRSAKRMAADIDRAYHARADRLAGQSSDATLYEEFEPHPRFDLKDERAWVHGGSGLWAADSPKVMVDVFNAFEEAGLRRLATDYLGERSAISVHKSLLRRVSPKVFEDAAGPGAKPSAWHQDGAFLGDVRALNVWLSLSRCGDEAPGLDVVPRRIDHIVPTGTDDACFEWSVSQKVADQAAGETGVLRPIFDPGDALLFDDLFLHSTAADPAMPSMRYAVESWFFGVSGFPPAYAPLAF